MSRRSRSAGTAVRIPISTTTSFPDPIRSSRATSETVDALLEQPARRRPPTIRLERRFTAPSSSSQPIACRRRTAAHAEAPSAALRAFEQPTVAGSPRRPASRSYGHCPNPRLSKAKLPTRAESGALLALQADVARLAGAARVHRCDARRGQGRAGAGRQGSVGGGRARQARGRSPGRRGRRAGERRGQGRAAGAELAEKRAQEEAERRAEAEKRARHEAERLAKEAARSGTRGSRRTGARRGRRRAQGPRARRAAGTNRDRTPRGDRTEGT